MDVESFSGRSDIILKTRSDHKRILVVEDDENMVDFMSKVLRDMLSNTEIVCVNSFEQAVGKIITNSGLNTKNPYDLIIADIFLEGVGTGIDLYKIIKRVYPNIPFFVMSTLSVELFYQSIAAEQKDNMFYLRKLFDFKKCKEELNKNLPKYFDNRNEIL